MVSSEVPNMSTAATTSHREHQDTLDPSLMQDDLSLIQSNSSLIQTDPSNMLHQVGPLPELTSLSGPQLNLQVAHSMSMTTLGSSSHHQFAPPLNTTPGSSTAFMSGASTSASFSPGSRRGSLFKKSPVSTLWRILSTVLLQISR